MKNFFFNRFISINQLNNKTPVAVDKAGKIINEIFVNHISRLYKFLSLKVTEVLEAAAKVEQNNYSALLGYRPPYVVSSVAQNSQLYAKFAIGVAITNQNWISGLNCTQRL